MNLLTKNMAINNGDVERRYADLTEVIASDPPDIMLFQEVSVDVGQTALENLVDRLGGDYDIRYAADTYVARRGKQGLAVVTSLPIVRSESARLQAGGTQPQVVELGDRSSPLVVTNLHLEASPKKENFRKQKIAELVQQLCDGHGGVRQIIAGDFNALPFFPSVKAMKRTHGYTSAHAAVHGKEPRFTFPAMNAEQLLHGKFMKPAELEKLQKVARLIGLFRKFDSDVPQYTIDYVFIKNGLQALAAELVVSKDIYSEPISDHAGIKVSLSSI
jgi:endonuclease/exonuclease/phosphatase family metal-dependent hydrolase